MTDRILLTPAAAGAVLMISGDSVRRLVAAGELIGVYPKPGGKGLRISSKQLEAYVARLEREAAAAERGLRLVGATGGSASRHNATSRAG